MTIPRQGRRENSRGRAGLPLLLLIFHLFVQIFIVYYVADIVLGVKKKIQQLAKQQNSTILKELDAST